MRAKHKSTVIMVVMALLMTLPMIGNVRANPQTVVEICPETIEVELGESFTVDIDFSDAIDIWILQFVLRYDPNVLEVTDVVGIPEMNVWIDAEITGVPTVHWGLDCDVIPDGVLDYYDLCVIACAFGSEPGDPGWNPRADINIDLKVNIDDFMLFLVAMEMHTLVDMPGTLQFRGVLECAWEGGTFATVTFEVIGPGVTTLDLDNTKLSTPCGDPILHEVRDGTVTVSPEQIIQSLVTTIESWNLPKGAENSLTPQLEAASDLLSKDNVIGAVHKLTDFIDHVEALRGKKLTNEQADYLAAMAQAVINALE